MYKSRLYAAKFIIRTLFAGRDRMGSNPLKMQSPTTCMISKMVTWTDFHAAITNSFPLRNKLCFKYFEGFNQKKYPARKNCGYFYYFTLEITHWAVSVVDECCCLTVQKWLALWIRLRVKNKSNVVPSSKRAKGSGLPELIPRSSAVSP